MRIISLDPESTLEIISLQALTAPPSSICIADMLDAGINKTQPTMFVNIGLQNGVLLRTVLDPINGQLTDTRTRLVLLKTLLALLTIKSLDFWALAPFVSSELQPKRTPPSLHCPPDLG